MDYEGSNAKQSELSNQPSFNSPHTYSTTYRKYYRGLNVSLFLFQGVWEITVQVLGDNGSVSVCTKSMASIQP